MCVCNPFTWEKERTGSFLDPRRGWFVGTWEGTLPFPIGLGRFKESWPNWVVVAQTFNPSTLESQRQVDL